MTTTLAPWRSAAVVLASLLAGTTAAQAANYSASLSATPTNFSDESGEDHLQRHHQD